MTVPQIRLLEHLQLMLNTIETLKTMHAQMRPRWGSPLYFRYALHIYTLEKLAEDFKSDAVAVMQASSRSLPSHN